MASQLIKLDIRGHDDRVGGTRLQQFIAAELAAFGGSFILSLSLYSWAVRSPWMMVLALICVAQCVTLAAALVLARRGNHRQSVTLVCIGNWASALLVTFVAPVLLAVMVPAALLPVVFAEPYVRWQRLLTFTAITAVCALALGALARLQDTSRLDDHTPGSVVGAFIIAAVPIMALLILLIVWHNGATLRSNAAALRASEKLLADHAAQLTASRARLISATDDERRRLERDLHDGAQQHLVALSVLIQLARAAEPEQRETLLIEASELLEAAITEIRRLAHGIYPPLLVSGGLAQALPAAAAHASVPVDVSLTGLGRYPAPTEAALYYCCTEALQNAAKHGGPDTTATISGHADDQCLTVTISDTGRGFDPATIGTGLTNMTDRLAAIGGQLTIDTAPGCGTRVTATVAGPAAFGGLIPELTGGPSRETSAPPRNS
jgi:signal transduction histidine kinase